jgi:hypothetical protein
MMTVTSLSESETAFFFSSKIGIGQVQHAVNFELGPKPTMTVVPNSRRRLIGRSLGKTVKLGIEVR